jgi:hypothetical protein
MTTRKAKQMWTGRTGWLLAVFVGELLFYLRGDGFLWAEEDLQTDVGDPAGLAVVRRDGLEAAAAHQH